MDASPRVAYFESPIGCQELVATSRGLQSSCFVDGPREDRSGDSVVLRRACSQLEEYYAGRRTEFDIDYDLRDVSPFRRRVLEALVRVPHGATVSYGELAAAAGSPGAARAVGAAMGANPLPIFIPCHRVLAADGIGGFGPGLPAKRHLLALEGIIQPAAQRRLFGE